MAKILPAPDEGALRIHQRLARNLGVRILSGKLKPGEGLGGEIEQAAAQRVSRSAYREAIRILVAKGFIESRPKAGTHVTPRDRWNLLDPEVLAWMFIGQPDRRFVRDLFELRSVIEPAAAALAAQRRTKAQVKEMRTALDDMATWGLSTVRGRDADQNFHRAILDAAANEALTSLSGSIGAAVTWTTFFKARAGIPRDALPDHEKVFVAIQAGNPKNAQRAMSDLVDAALQDMGFERRISARAGRRGEG